MSFTPEQINALKAPLSKEHVKARTQAGRSLSYIEGWHAIDEANRIFGFGNWSRETLEMRELGGEPRQVNGKWRVAFAAKVRVRVWSTDGAGLVEREGFGYGSGIAADLGDAYESAIKEAETDAMKRALMTFGNPFGLALYDKEQRNVTAENAAPPPEPDESKLRYLDECRAKIERSGMTEAQLRQWWRAESDNRRSFGLTQDNIDALLSLLERQIKALRRHDDEQVAA